MQIKIFQLQSNFLLTKGKELPSFLLVTLDFEFINQLSTNNLLLYSVSTFNIIVFSIDLVVHNH